MTNSKKVNYVREEQKHLLSYSVSASDSPACVHYAAEPEIIPTTEEANLAIAPSSVLPTQHKVCSVCMTAVAEFLCHFRGKNTSMKL